MLRPWPKAPFPRAAPAGSKRYSPAGCPAEPKAEISKTNVVRVRLSEYKML
jgi:hypothetical protein